MSNRKNAFKYRQTPKGRDLVKYPVKSISILPKSTDAFKQKGKTYYFRVIAYKTINGSKIWSADSKTVKFECKK